MVHVCPLGKECIKQNWYDNLRNDPSNSSCSGKVGMRDMHFPVSFVQWYHNASHVSSTDSFLPTVHINSVVTITNSRNIDQGIRIQYLGALCMKAAWEIEKEDLYYLDQQSYSQTDR